MGRCLRKWEWVANKLNELGCHDLSEMARQIDEALVKLYGDEHTEDWKKDYQEIEEEFEEFKGSIVDALDLILDVADDSSYCVACVACVENDNKCDVCKFGKEHGICVEKGSLFSNFIERLKQESAKRTEELIKTLGMDEETAKLLRIWCKTEDEQDLKRHFPNIQCVKHLGEIHHYFERFWLWENSTHRVITHDDGNGYCTILTVFPKLGKLDRKVILPKLLESDDAIVYIWEDDRKHVAWMTTDGKVISFEDILGNSGDPSLSVWDNLEHYIEAIKNVDWIVRGVGKEFEECLKQHGLWEKWLEEVKDLLEDEEVV